MGQTLSNGVYLPNEGERNCYAGLASNWQILNTAVGNIAEKAPLVHPHGNISNDGKVGTTANLPLITGTGGAVQAGSFGNQANTFCEGNDSRLSDARTPVAHTHVTADVTDLLNSAHEWTADQTIASNRFLRVYGYKFQVKNASMELGTVPSSNQWTGMQFVDKNNTTISEIVQSFQGNGNTLYRINIYPNEANSQSRGVIAYTYNSTNNVNTLQVTSNLLPSDNNTYDLGSSNQKWKTLNGINPGALSLPNINYTEGNPDVYNVGTDINNLTKNVSDPLHFSWTAPVDGWLAIMWYLSGIQPPYNVLVTTGDARYSKFSQTWSASSTRWYLASTFPVVKNVTYYFEIDFQNTTIGVVHHAYLLPCLGNV